MQFKQPQPANHTPISATLFTDDKFDEYSSSPLKINSTIYTEPNDPLPEVEIFNYPSIEKMRLEFEKTNKYSPTQIDKFINSYAKLLEYKNRA